MIFYAIRATQLPQYNPARSVSSAKVLNSTRMDCNPWQTMCFTALTLILTYRHALEMNIIRV